MASEQTNSCPNCGYEYYSWVEACPDCGTPLVSSESLRPKVEEPVLKPQEDPEWTVVANMPNSIMASFVKSKLEGEGIPVLMFRAGSADIAEFSHNDYVPQNLLVPKAMWKQARQLVYATPADRSAAFEDEWEVDDEVEGEAGEKLEATPGEADGEYSYVRGGTERPDGELPSGWQWAGEEPEPDAARRFSHRKWGRDSEQPEALEEDSDEPLERDKERFGSDYVRGDYEYETGGWTQPSRLTKIVYGVLLLVLMLPFLIQMVQYVYSLMSSVP